MQVDLSDAMEELEETQYERYISDQKKLLDDLYNEYESVLNLRLDNVDALLSECISTINAESGIFLILFQKKHPMLDILFQKQIKQYGRMMVKQILLWRFMVKTLKDSSHLSMLL